jgi:hypothetical protein
MWASIVHDDWSFAAAAALPHNVHTSLIWLAVAGCSLECAMHDKPQTGR